MDGLSIAWDLEKEDYQGPLLGNLGLIHMSTGDYAAAEKAHKEALDINHRLGNLLGKALNRGNLGLVYRNAGDYAAAEKAHKEALEIFRHLGNRLGEANQLGNLGSVYLQQDDYDTAENAYKEALKIQSQIGNLLGEAQALGNLGNLAAFLKRCKAALVYLEASLDRFERLGASPQDAANVRENIKECKEELCKQGVDPNTIPPLDLDNLPQIT